MAKKKKKAKKSQKLAGVKPAKKKPADDFFVSINEPAAIQVPLLEGRKMMLESMRLFSDLRELRRHKAEYRHQLREQISLITKSIAKIRSSIPNVQVEDAPSLPVRRTQQSMEEEMPTPVPIHSVDKIEEGLRDIESKLAQLQR